MIVGWFWRLWVSVGAGGSTVFQGIHTAASAQIAVDGKAAPLWGAKTS
jgi:hypothetical protein